MEAESVLAQIRSAFAATPPPGDSFDAISVSHDDEGIVEYFRGKGWEGHDVHALRYHYVALNLFTGSAFRYWLPAFMIAEVKQPIEADVIADALLYSLVDRADKRLPLFSDQELAAIASVFDYCAQQSGDPDFAHAAMTVRSRIGSGA